MAGGSPAVAWRRSRPARARLRPRGRSACARGTLVRRRSGIDCRRRTPIAVRALALYEPVLFSLLDAESPPPNEADGIRAAAGRRRRGARRGRSRRVQPSASSISGWAEARGPECRTRAKVRLRASIINIRQWAAALLDEPHASGGVLESDDSRLVHDGHASRRRRRAASRGSSRSVLPQLEVVEFKGVGHMGPITHPEVVNDAIARFLERC